MDQGTGVKSEAYHRKVVYVHIFYLLSLQNGTVATCPGWEPPQFDQPQVETRLTLAHRCVFDRRVSLRFEHRVVHLGIRPRLRRAISWQWTQRRRGWAPDCQSGGRRTGSRADGAPLVPFAGSQHIVGSARTNSPTFGRGCEPPSACQWVSGCHGRISFCNIRKLLQ